MQATQVTTLLVVFLVHWFADFVVQTRWQAENKSKNWYALAEHILAYSFILWVVFGPYYAFINGLLHACTDAVSSRVSSYAYANKKMKLFWGTIGFDQFVHHACLLLTMEYIW